MAISVSRDSSVIRDTREHDKMRESLSLAPFQPRFRPCPLPECIKGVVQGRTNDEWGCGVVCECDRKVDVSHQCLWSPGDAPGTPQQCTTGAQGRALSRNHQSARVIGATCEQQNGKNEVDVYQMRARNANFDAAALSVVYYRHTLTVRAE